ncbi:MAG TPA: hypothetical protein VMY37_27815 [Thermoguttaceae bacterium]|nr:hypothetical protein [Thermoguttaceae bacterium]
MNKHVELLRNPPCDQRWYGPDAIMGQAADEIERLEAANERFLAANMRMTSEIKRLEAHNKRLESTLESYIGVRMQLRAELAEAKAANEQLIVQLNSERDNFMRSLYAKDFELAEAKAVTAEPSDPSPELVKAAEEFAKTIWLTAQWPTAINRQSPTAAAILALCAVMKGELTDGE